MHFFKYFIILCSIIFGVEGRILFPEEIVSFLSFVYSVLPPIKIGKDSRIGAGFRVGQNADFQFLVELGPQSETQPLGPGSNSARDTRANKRQESKPNIKLRNKRKQFRSTTIPPKETSLSKNNASSKTI